MKFVHTTSYIEAVMLPAVRDIPVSWPGRTATSEPRPRFGLRWLNKMWDDATGTLYYQVGIGDGNG